MSDYLQLAEPRMPELPPEPSPPEPVGGVDAGLVDFAIGQAARGALFKAQIENSYNSMRYVDDEFGRRNSLYEAATRRNKAIEAETGASLENPLNGGYDADARGRLQPYERVYGDQIVDVRTQARRPLLDEQLSVYQEKLAELDAQYPQHAETIGARRPILADARLLANHYADAAAAGVGLGAIDGVAASFIGGAAGFFRNPANAVTMGMTLGGATGATLVARVASGVLREAAANAGQQALSEPAVQSWRAELGRESGLMPALEDIGMAALFGGAIGGAAPIVGRLWHGAASPVAALETAKRASEGERAALRDLAATGVAEKEPALRSLSDALEADVAVFDGAPEGVKGLEATVSQALDHAEGLSDALPELPARQSAVGSRQSDEALSALDPGPNHDPYEAAALLRGSPDLAEAARAHDAPDIAVAGRLASLGDAAFEAARKGEVSTEVALATASRVVDEGEQLSVMRAAQDELRAVGLDRSEQKISADEASEAVSREMQARALPQAQSGILETAPSAAVPDAHGFDRVGERLQKQTAQLERELIAKAPEQDAAVGGRQSAVVGKKRTVTRQFPTLFETLASEGGLAPHPELKAIFDGNPFVPGFGRLVRPGGKSLDQALQAAKDLGYMFDAADHGSGELKLAVNDLLDLLRREAHGDKVYSFADLQEMASRDAARAGADYEKAKRAALKKLKTQPELRPDKERGWTPNENILDRAAALMVEDDELTPSRAWDFAAVDYERDLLARTEQFPELQEARLAETDEIPGWDFPANDAADAKAAPGDGVSGARAGEAAAATGGDAGGAGEGARGPGGDIRASGEVNVEPGAEGLPQQLIPGVAPVTDRQRAELAASKPLRGGDRAPPAGGLFDEGARAQNDLFDAPTQSIAIERGDGSVEFVSREKLLAPDNGEEIAGLIEQCRD